MMKTISSLFALTLLAASLHAGGALACDTCGCQDGADAPAACACGMDPAECTACGDAQPATMACGCPDGECACEAAEAGMHAHGAESLPDWHAKSPAGLSVGMRQLEAFDVAYLPGTFGDDMDALYGELMAHADQQGLLGDETRVGAFMPGVEHSEPTEDSVINIAIWNLNGGQISAPVKTHTIAGGTYMVVEHWGDYALIGETYMSAVTWAQESGIELSDQPSFVHHVNDPASAPVKEWLTEIYLPFEHSATATADAGSDDRVG